MDSSSAAASEVTPSSIGANGGSEDATAQPGGPSRHGLASKIGRRPSIRGVAGQVTGSPATAAPWRSPRTRPTKALVRRRSAATSTCLKASRNVTPALSPTAAA
jgi:hypothetical protein